MYHGPIRSYTGRSARVALASLYMFTLCACVCVCVCEREREREREQKACSSRKLCMGGKLGVGRWGVGTEAAYRLIM